MDYEYFLQRIHGVIMPSTGCTEPVAIALNTATARANAQGEVRQLTITLDNYLYKNAMGVGIPGADERGVALCAAMGVTAGDATAKMRVLDHVSPEALGTAKKMVAEGRVTVKTRSDVHGLLVESVLETDSDTVRVLTLQSHTNIVRVDHAPFEAYVENEDGSTAGDPICDCKLSEMIAFAKEVPLAELRFLQDGIDMNMAVAQEGLKFGLGRAVDMLIRQGAIGDSPVSRAEKLCAAQTGGEKDIRLCIRQGNRDGGLMLQLDQHVIDVFNRVGITEIVLADFDFYIQATYQVADLAAMREVLGLSSGEQLCLTGENAPLTVVSEDGVRRQIAQ